MIQCRSRKHTKSGESLSFFQKTSRRKMRNGRIQIKLRFDTFGTITIHFSSVYWFFLLTKKCVFTSDQKLLRIWFYRPFLSILFVTFIRRQNNNSSMKLSRLKNPRRKKYYWILLLFILLLFVVIFRLLFEFERWWQKRRERERKKNLKSISFQIANNIDNDRFFWKHSFKTKI